ncbi:unnamed protein product [Allacma fusca]|uniref:BEN domain-containing protein n=1 Tax=Allacma fusca TaxID=39272 RepID=A0A8J2LIN0_9HEXA|nr:unnamed protein product [Allacma fusca]
MHRATVSTEQLLFFCGSTKIAFDTKQFPTVRDTIGSELPVVWDDTGEEYQATIIDIGRKSDMARMAAELAKKACEQSFVEKEATGTKRARLPKQMDDDEFQTERKSSNNQRVKKRKTAASESQVREEASSVIHVLKERQNANILIGESSSSIIFSSHSEEPLIPEFDGASQAVLATVIQEKDKEIEDLRKQLLREKNKVLNLQKDRIPDNDELLDFGNEVHISKQLVESIRDRYRGSPSQFLRALMEQTGVFTLEEISKHSVYGRKSSSSPENLRPALPPKFISLKDYVERESGLCRGSASFIKFELSVRGICSDARKRLKKQVLRTEETIISD